MTDENEKRRPFFRSAGIVAAVGALAYLVMPAPASATDSPSRWKPVLRSARAIMGLPTQLDASESQGVPPLKRLLEPNADLDQVEREFVSRTWMTAKNLSSLQGLSDTNRVELKLAAVEFANHVKSSMQTLKADRSKLLAEHGVLSGHAEQYLSRLQAIRASANLDDIKDACQ